MRRRPHQHCDASRTVAVEDRPPAAVIDIPDAHACFLLNALWWLNDHSPVFVVPAASIAKRFGWSKQQVIDARDELIARGHFRCIGKPSSGRCVAVYEWTLENDDGAEDEDYDDVS